MFNSLIPMFALSAYGSDSEYYNLTEEEKANVDYMDSCIYSENEHINDASFKMMMLLMKISAEPDAYEPENVSEEINKILEGLTKEEAEIINKFIPACINSMGIYNEESKLERKLKRERKDKK